MTAFAPYSYILDWNAAVLKELFDTQALFAYPHQVVSAGHIVLSIYMRVRKEFSHKKRFVFTLDDIASTCRLHLKTHTSKGTEMTDKQQYAHLVNRVWSAVSKPFYDIHAKSHQNGDKPKYDAPTAIRQGKRQDLRSKPYTTLSLSGELGGYKWKLLGENLTATKPAARKFELVIENISSDNIILSSIPEDIREDFVVGGKLSSDKLKQAGRGTKAPTIFNNNLPLVKEFIHNPRDVRKASVELSDMISEIIPPGLGILDNPKHVKYVKRTYFLKVVVDDIEEYLFHQYMTPLEIEQQLKLVSNSSNCSEDDLLDPINGHIEKTAMFPRAEGGVLSAEDFDNLYMSLKEKHEDVSTLELFNALNAHTRTIRSKSLPEILVLISQQF